MGIDIRIEGSCVRVLLTGWDRALTMRRVVRLDRASITAARVATRSSLEPSIDHRVVGRGTHNGARHPGRRRIGIMMGRAVHGKQLWAVGAGEPSENLLVLDLSGHEFNRAVLAVADPEAAAMALTRPS